MLMCNHYLNQASVREVNLPILMREAWVQEFATSQTWCPHTIAAIETELKVLMLDTLARYKKVIQCGGSSK